MAKILKSPKTRRITTSAFIPFSKTEDYQSRTPLICLPLMFLSEDTTEGTKSALDSPGC